MIPSPPPELPWQNVAADLFELDGKHYLSMIDHYSRFIELIELQSEIADNFINAINNIFALYGIAAAVCSGNGPRFVVQFFLQFAKTYGFTHITSNPRYAQGNGEAGCSVQTAKNFLRKSADPYLTLLAYRITPTHMGYSPVQLLMNRQLCSTLPFTISALKLATPNKSSVATKDQAAKQ